MHHSENIAWVIKVFVEEDTIYRDNINVIQYAVKPLPSGGGYKALS
jgi:hypothetical protein